MERALTIFAQETNYEPCLRRLEAIGSDATDGAGPSTPFEPIGVSFGWGLAAWKNTKILAFVLHDGVTRIK